MINFFIFLHEKGSFYCTFFKKLFISLFAEFLSLPCISTSPLPTLFLECSVAPSQVRWTVHRPVLIAAWVLFPVQSLVSSLQKKSIGAESIFSIPAFSSFYSIVSGERKLQKTACTYLKLGYMKDLENGRCSRTKSRKDE